MEPPPNSGWYAVRCIFRSNWPPATNGLKPSRYEERITLWQATDADEALALAETEAREYAAIIEEAPSEYLGLAQSYELSDAPGPGAEVFSMMRDSGLEPDNYLDAFFDTGDEHQTHLSTDE